MASESKKAKLAPEGALLEVPEGTTLEITFPDDFHHHFRDGDKTKRVLAHATERFRRCIAMPNLKPPVTTTELATKYYNELMGNLPSKDLDFEPLMTLYLTDNTTPEEIRKAKETGFIHAAKYYPAGATTNSDFGVTALEKTYPALKAMEEVGMVLCIHSEVSRCEIDIFDREAVFIEEVMKPLLRDFTKLTIVMEHISTDNAVEFVKNGPPNLAASITAHHLLYNRNGKYSLDHNYQADDQKKRSETAFLFCSYHLILFRFLYNNPSVIGGRHQTSFLLLTNPQT